MPKPTPWSIRPPFGEPPVGAVMPFAGGLGASIPDTAKPANTPASASPPVTEPLEAWGWMLCDGRSLDTKSYPELFAALSYLYGGSGDNFNIPDYRGSFMRGTDLGADKDPETNIRTKPDGTGNYDGVGSVQSYALQDHQHDFKVLATPSKGTTISAFSPSGSPGDTGFVKTAPPSDPPIMVSKFETRPANIAVNYIIKFTYGLRPFHGD